MVSLSLFSVVHDLVGVDTRPGVVELNAAAASPRYAKVREALENLTSALLEFSEIYCQVGYLITVT